jgi:cob(I)alamin adenosyltransferase
LKPSKPNKKQANKAMKIYTKTGDKGTTALVSGRRVAKNHVRIEAYGTVDELNAYIGLLRDQAVCEPYKALLLEVQDRLFTIGSLLAADPERPNAVALPPIVESDVLFLEDAIDELDSALPPMRNFVLPGGHQSVSFAHIARTVCRRAERRVIDLEEAEQNVNPLIVQYLNRLSDYLFMLSRKLSQDTQAEETPWKPRLA